MAIYKAGQRVKRIAAFDIGNTGTVDSDPGGDYVNVHWDRDTPGFLWRDGGGTNGSWMSGRSTIAPLTDPKADQFIESIKKLKPYEEPKRTRTPEIARYFIDGSPDFGG